jgi:hypothetical protein
MGPALRAEAPAILLLAILAAAPFIGFGDGWILTLLARAMILAMAAVALSLLVGGAGLVSMGHAAMLGFGAYAVVILDDARIVDATIVLPAAIGAGALFALVTGAVAIRTSGVHFIMITLAFGQMAIAANQVEDQSRQFLPLVLITDLVKHGCQKCRRHQVAALVTDQAGGVATEVIEHLNKVIAGDTQLGKDVLLGQRIQFHRVDAAVRKQCQHDQPRFGPRTVCRVHPQRAARLPGWENVFFGLQCHHGVSLL